MVRAVRCELVVPVGWVARAELVLHPINDIRKSKEKSVPVRFVDFENGLLIISNKRRVWALADRFTDEADFMFDVGRTCVCELVSITDATITCRRRDVPGPAWTFELRTDLAYDEKLNYCFVKGVRVHRVNIDGESVQRYNATYGQNLHWHAGKVDFVFSVSHGGHKSVSSIDRASTWEFEQFPGKSLNFVVSLFEHRTPLIKSASICAHGNLELCSETGDRVVFTYVDGQKFNVCFNGRPASAMR